MCFFESSNQNHFTHSTVPRLVQRLVGSGADANAVFCKASNKKRAQEALVSSGVCCDVRECVCVCVCVCV